MSYESDVQSTRIAQFKVPYSVSLLAGGAAGLAVDVSLFPLDTLKTRLQSSEGFWKSGGIKNIYSGILPAAMGSVPTAALFFFSYNASKAISHDRLSSKWAPVCHALSACVGEVAACTTRVPVEVVKQRLQAERSQMTTVIQKAVREEGFLGLYRGYGSTLLRELPFSALQFPLWEWMKILYGRQVRRSLRPVEGAACGAVAGGISAALTTPLDVGKTRIMLYKVQTSSNSHLKAVPSLRSTLAFVYRERGINGLFAGVVPRTIWITVGGFVFFGVYELTVDLLLPEIRCDKADKIR